MIAQKLKTRPGYATEAGSIKGAKSSNVAVKVTPEPAANATPNRRLAFALGDRVSSNKVTNVWMLWSEVCTRLEKPKRSKETLEKYLSLSTDEQLRLKDVGYYVPGHFDKGIRGKTNIRTRDCLTLDIDHAPTDCVDRLKDEFLGLGEYAFVLHSTRKHSENEPRLRLILPLLRPVTELEHQAIARKLANDVATMSDASPIDWFDDTTFEFTRVMFLPSVCAFSPYVFHVNEGRWVDPDEILGKYDDPTDVSSWPVSSRFKERIITGNKKSGNPLEKPGVIGAFNRAYTIHQAMDKFIPGVYVPGAHDDRMTFAAGTSANGALIYDSGTFLFSRHESDPCYYQNCNAFDMVRIHLFGKLDDEVDAATPITEKPSYLAMRDYALKDEAVVAELGSYSNTTATDFDEFDTVEKNNGCITREDFYNYLPGGNQYIFMPTGELWPATSVDKRLPPMPLSSDAVASQGDDASSDSKTSGKKKKKKLFEAASVWISKHRRVEQMTWCPGEPHVIRNRLVAGSGWITREGVTCYNLYKPPIIEPGDASQASRWLDHVHRVYGTEADHIIKWFAHRVQHPGRKINHAIVLGGKQGIGKDTMLEPIKQAVGPWNFADESPTRLLGRFNGFVKSVILRVSEARDLGEVDRFSFYDHMKPYCAAPPDVLSVDEKFVKAYPVFNVTGVIVTTNHQTDGIYLPSDDRRHFVAWSDLTKDDFTADYWNNLWSWYKQGGINHVCAYLRSMDLSDFDPYTPPRKTAAFWSIVDSNRAPEDAELADAIEKLGNPDALTIQMLVAHATVGFGEWLRDRRNRRIVPHRLENVGYATVRNGTADDGLWRISGQRQVVYARSDLSLRDRFTAAGALVATAPKKRSDEDFAGMDESCQ